MLNLRFLHTRIWIRFTYLFTKCQMNREYWITYGCAELYQICYECWTWYLMHASDRNVWAQRTAYSPFFLPYGGLAGIFLNIYNYMYRVEMHGDISSILGGLWTWPLKLHLRYKNELNWRLVLAVFLSVFWFSSVPLNSIVNVLFINFIESWAHAWVFSFLFLKLCEKQFEKWLLKIFVFIINYI